MPYQINQPMCSGCHQCRVHCPADAILFKGTKYWIDPDKCIECGTCVEYCHNGVISLMGETAVQPETKPLRELSCDVLVIGGGGSGLLAAARAAELTGKKVLVIEKNWETGGNSWYACGFRSHYSKLHEKLGMPDDRKERIDKLYDDIGGALSKELLWNTLDANTRLMDWLAESCGAEGELGIGKSPSGNPAVVFAEGFKMPFERPDPSIGPGGMGSYVVLKMRKRCAELGVDILTGCPAKKLLTGEDGSVIGAMAETAQEDLKISCGVCVLATGCFSRNDALIAKTNPSVFTPGEPIHHFSVPTCTGDGLLMAEAIGADIDYHNVHVCNMGPAHHPFGYAGVCISRQPEVIQVNLEGKRWKSEFGRMPASNEFLKQPGLIQYSIADENILVKTISDALARTVDGEAGIKALSNYRQEIEAESKMDTPVKVADTLEELAELMGVPADNLVAEVKKYNEFCKNGRDEDFGKDPRFLMPLEKAPYYAFYEKRFMENAMGGVVIDPELHALRPDGSVIPGLYACGDNSRGVVMPEPETFRVEMTISALTWSVSSGFLAGEKAAEYLLSQK